MAATSMFSMNSTFSAFMSLSASIPTIGESIAPHAIVAMMVAIITPSTCMLFKYTASGTKNTATSMNCRNIMALSLNLNANDIFVSPNLVLKWEKI